jgi:hypothetical protein
MNIPFFCHVSMLMVSRRCQLVATAEPWRMLLRCTRSVWTWQQGIFFGITFEAQTKTLL